MLVYKLLTSKFQIDKLVCYIIIFLEELVDKIIG